SGKEARQRWRPPQATSDRGDETWGRAARATERILTGPGRRSGGPGVEPWGRIGSSAQGVKLWAVAGAARPSHGVRTAGPCPGGVSEVAARVSREGAMVSMPVSRRGFLKGVGAVAAASVLPVGGRAGGAGRAGAPAGARILRGVHA